MFHQPIAVPRQASQRTRAPEVDHRHRPTRTSIRLAGDTKRGVCAVCGCQLVRTQATRIWYQSGPLG